MGNKITLEQAYALVDQDPANLKIIPKKYLTPKFVRYFAKKNPITAKYMPTFWWFYDYKGRRFYNDLKDTYLLMATENPECVRYIPQIMWKSNDAFMVAIRMKPELLKCLTNQKIRDWLFEYSLISDWLKTTNLQNV